MSFFSYLMATFITKKFNRYVAMGLTTPQDREQMHYWDMQGKKNLDRETKKTRQEFIDKFKSRVFLKKKQELLAMTEARRIKAEEQAKALELRRETFARKQADTRISLLGEIERNPVLRNRLVSLETDYEQWLRTRRSYDTQTMRFKDSEFLRLCRIKKIVS